MKNGPLYYPAFINMHFKIMKMGHFYNFFCEEMIFPEGSGNIISSHKKLWKCHSHYFNDQNIHLLPEEFEFISCKYLNFVENLQTKK